MNKHEAKLIKVIVWAGIYVTIGSVWRLLEYIEFGQPMPSVSDTIIGAVFALSLYKNLHIRVKEEGGQE